MPNDTHHLVKTIVIPQVAKLLMERFGISEDKAVEIIYTSPTGKCLDDDSYGLYGQSALYIFSLIEDDIQKNLQLLK